MFIYALCIIAGFALIMCQDRTATPAGWILMTMGSIMLGVELG